MSKIVYSTAVSKETIKAYEYYQKCLEKQNINDSQENKVKTSAAYIAFANACEKENKTALAVINSLNS